MSSVVHTNTQEGIELEFECIGKVYKEDEKDEYCISIYGKDAKELIAVTIPEPKTEERTCATVINRIPDVINAQPGFITTDSLEAPVYKAKPINYYIK